MELYKQIYYCLIPFVGLVFTEGFLFLSGFGCFCSLYKDSCVIPFYKKRIKRLLPPYWIMVIPLCLLTFYNGEPFTNIILEILSFKYWIFGNTALWYVSVSLVLYLMCPLLFRYCFNKCSGVLVRFIFGVVSFYLLGFIIWFLFPNYYKVTYLGFTQIPMFLFGMGVGYLFMNKIELKKEIVYFTFISFAFAGVLLSFSNGILERYRLRLCEADMKQLVGLPPQSNYYG